MYFLFPRKQKHLHPAGFCSACNLHLCFFKILPYKQLASIIEQCISYSREQKHSHPFGFCFVCNLLYLCFFKIARYYALYLNYDAFTTSNEKLGIIIAIIIIGVTLLIFYPQVNFCTGSLNILGVCINVGSFQKKSLTVGSSDQIWKCFRIYVYRPISYKQKTCVKNRIFIRNGTFKRTFSTFIILFLSQEKETSANN